MFFFLFSFGSCFATVEKDIWVILHNVKKSPKSLSEIHVTVDACRASWSLGTACGLVILIESFFEDLFCRPSCNPMKASTVISFILLPVNPKCSIVSNVEVVLTKEEAVTVDELSHDVPLDPNPHETNNPPKWRKERIRRKSSTQCRTSNFHENDQLWLVYLTKATRRLSSTNSSSSSYLQKPTAGSQYGWTTHPNSQHVETTLHSSYVIIIVTILQ